MANNNSNIKDAKKVFRKKGACSHTLFYLLNREFGYPQEIYERAADPLAGGVMQLGYQCGMLWGSTLAVGAEASRRFSDRDIAISAAISATQQIMDSFRSQTNAHDCFDVTECDWSSKLAMAKFMLTGKFLSCFRLADKWADKAVQAARAGLSYELVAPKYNALSCASEVVKAMGGSNAEMVMVAGFAGGMGLSGNSCGVLSAAIWMNTIGWAKDNPGKFGMPNPIATRTLEKYYDLTEYKMLCREFTSRDFASIEEHADYLSNGGCRELIDSLARVKYVN